MGMTNHSNRIQNSQQLGAVSTTKEIGLIQAQKKVLVHQVSVVDVSAIAASESVYVSLKLKKNGTDLTDPAEIDSILGVAARGEMALIPASPIELEKGDFLSLVVTVASTGALTNASAHSDIEVVGN